MARPTHSLLRAHHPRSSCKRAAALLHCASAFRHQLFVSTTRKPSFPGSATSIATSMDLAARWTPGLADRALPAPTSRAAWCLPPAALAAAARQRAARRERGAPGAPAAAAAALAAPQRQRRQRRRLALVAASSNNGVTAPGGNGDAAAAGTQQLGEPDPSLVWTKFVAETLLPTKQGKFRLRGYRHTVSAAGEAGGRLAGDRQMQAGCQWCDAATRAVPS